MGTMANPLLIQCTLCVLMTGFDVSPAVDISNNPPILSNSGEVYIKGLTYEFPYRGALLKVSNSGETQKLFIGEQNTATDLTFNESMDQLSFGLHSVEQEQSLGIFAWKKDSEVKTKLYTSAEAQADLSATHSPLRIDWMTLSNVSENSLVTRLSDSVHNKRYLVRKNESSTELLLEEEKDNVSFIFVPRGNTNGITAVKLRKGPPGALGEAQPDVIVKITADNQSEILKDQDADPQSPYERFTNTAAVNENGDIAILAGKANEIVVVLVSVNGKKEEIKLPEGVFPRAFNLGFNNKKEIALIATDMESDAIILWSNNEWKIKAKSGDIARYKQEDVTINRSNSLTFHGGVGLNEKGEIAVLTSLATKEGKALPSGILLIRN